MALQTIVKQGAFDHDVAAQINAMFTELYATIAGGALASTKILVGNGGGVATAVNVSGDASLANTGALTVLSIGGVKYASGEHTQVATSDTIVTGLATVTAVVITPRINTVKQLYFDASIGDQAGTPAAGSFLLLSKKPTAVNDCTPTNATDFTENIKVNWVAVGT